MSFYNIFNIFIDNKFLKIFCVKKVHVIIIMLYGCSNKI